MSNKSKINEYESDLIGELLKSTSKVESEKIRNKMLLAAKIEDRMNAMGIKKSKFAELLGKQPSVITKWFSGTHNFTVDTLWDIEKILNMKIVNFEEEKAEEIRVFKVHVSGSYQRTTQIGFDSVIGEIFASPESIQQCHQQLQSKVLANVSVFQ